MLGHPERDVTPVVVGGTNGKGSVSSLIARAALEQGLNVGLFTSPHLHRLTERIRINGREIGKRRLVGSLRKVATLVEAPGGPPLTFFETLTVVAADLFSSSALDLAVLEVGLGGRLDATRVFPAKVVVITNIALDHQAYLGDTIESIAREKFALSRRGAIVVSGSLQSELVPLLESRARATRSEIWRAGVDFDWELGEDQTIDYRGPAGVVEGLRSPLLGAHQAHNLAVALTAIAALRRKGVDIRPESILRATRRFRWPARMERALGGKVIFDVAHNPAGAVALCSELPSVVGTRRPVVVVLGCMRDKDVEGIARPLRRVADEVFLAAPRMPRALEPEAFPKWLQGRPFPSVESALDGALSKAGEEGLVVVTGSTFVIAEARAHLLGLKKVDPSVPM